MNKDSLVLTVSFVTYMERNDHLSENGKLWRLFERLEDELRRVTSDTDLTVDCYQSSVYAIGAGLEPDNLGKCMICDEWVSAQNKPDIIGELGTGAEYLGDLYCEDHLPEESPVFAKLFPFGRMYDES